MQVKFDQKLRNLQMFPINEDGPQLGNRVNQMPSGWEELFLDEALTEKTGVEEAICNARSLCNFFNFDYKFN